MQDLCIERATGADAERLTTLLHASGAYRGSYASILAGYRLTPEYLADRPTFLVEDDGDLLGFYSLIVEPAELDLLFVSDAAQGLGLGRVLVQHMLDQARRLGIPAVRVVSHPPAEGFYRRMGARPAGVVPPKPPRVPWERPELVFDVPGLS
ncbi:Acetyltransferase (GNAT) family protein [Streptoalloteichus tenebrarius]|uniref:Acetyltransferase (GNAT) family protein n=1 Tax=Streptoalloteichus tenebrarius (strain ATCC 17920 / DSM 40477 / JCM 4838 / CBS 697.72 / NBRC 16177 / NCIMB 11028 / NRRL B-12390 / A12253. 1 / ISP 5477) TaxID=1933 RepID=A0ABT1HQ09_STRSD|nr:GNAT family N-acetyltransferase [Streptoalloteichus tenebrarius]MCP2257587.1 Acetyltransferase (GNAT) family protein [Streptoalloteichus tenebrarius]BFE98543.1 GNAT family N-acetyltransferase [Streptoalloteichus tenebrarius]